MGEREGDSSSLSGKFGRPLRHDWAAAPAGFLEKRESPSLVGGVKRGGF